MSYDREFRVWYGERGSDSGANKGDNSDRGIWQDPARRSVVKRDESGSALRTEKGNKEWERVEWTNRVRANDRDRALEHARARAPHGMKVVMMREVTP